MNTSEKTERTKDSRQRDSSPRPNSHPKAKKKVQVKPGSLHYIESTEEDRVKRYFIGKELQKVWQKVSYTGRQRIVKHYASVNVIVCEADAEEPHPDEDDSIPSQPMYLEDSPDSTKFEFELHNNLDSAPIGFYTPSSISDFSNILNGPSLIVPPTPSLEIELIIDRDHLSLAKGIEPLFDFFEFICDDTWSKVSCCDLGCSYNPTIFQGKLDEEDDAQSHKDEQHAQTPGSSHPQEEDEENGIQGSSSQCYYKERWLKPDFSSLQKSLLS